MNAKRPAIPYSDAIADEIVARVVAGEIVTDICRRRTMPAYPVLVGWLESHPGFQERYLNACRHRANMLANEVLRVIRDTELAPQDKQVRIKGLIWAVERTETHTGSWVRPRKEGRSGRNGLPFGIRPASNQTRSRASGRPPRR